jgi:hypothetical protein
MSRWKVALWAGLGPMQVEHAKLEAGDRPHLTRNRVRPLGPSRRLGHGPHRRRGVRPSGVSVLGAAGIEPATPSLPSMRGRFVAPRLTSRPLANSEVNGAAEGGGVWEREVACGAVSGKSLARIPAGCTSASTPLASAARWMGNTALTAGLILYWAAAVTVAARLGVVGPSAAFLRCGR